MYNNVVKNVLRVKIYNQHNIRKHIEKQENSFRYLTLLFL